MQAISEQNKKKERDEKIRPVEDFADSIFSECLPTKRLSDQSKKKDKERGKDEFLYMEDTSLSKDETTPISTKKRSPQMYHRSLSTTVIEPNRNLVSLPPVRRDPRTQDQASTKRDVKQPNNQGTSNLNKIFLFICGIVFNLELCCFSNYICE